MEVPDPLRKSLGLVFCDIVGSTRLVARVGDLVAAAVIREFIDHADRLSRQHHSLMIKFSGDTFLAAFENMNDVMPFIVSIEGLLTPNSALERLEGFRFSLHYGNVLIWTPPTALMFLVRMLLSPHTLARSHTRTSWSFRRLRWSGCRPTTSSVQARVKFVLSNGSETWNSGV